MANQARAAKSEGSKQTMRSQPENQTRPNSPKEKSKRQRGAPKGRIREVKGSLYNSMGLMRVGSFRVKPSVLIGYTSNDTTSIAGLAVTVYLGQGSWSDEIRLTAMDANSFLITMGEPVIPSQGEEEPAEPAPKQERPERPERNSQQRESAGQISGT